MEAPPSHQVTRELTAAKAQIEKLQKALAGGSGRAAAGEAGERVRGELTFAQLQVGQLDERMSELVEETLGAGQQLWDPPGAGSAGASSSSSSLAAHMAASHRP